MDLGEGTKGTTDFEATGTGKADEFVGAFKRIGVDVLDYRVTRDNCIVRWESGNGRISGSGGGVAKCRFQVLDANFQIDDFEIGNLEGACEGRDLGF